MYHSSKLSVRDRYLTMDLQGAYTVPEHGSGPWWSIHMANSSAHPHSVHKEGGALSMVSDEITVPAVVLQCQVQP